MKHNENNNIDIENFREKLIEKYSEDIGCNIEEGVCALAAGALIRNPNSINELSDDLKAFQFSITIEGLRRYRTNSWSFSNINIDSLPQQNPEQFHGMHDLDSINHALINSLFSSSEFVSTCAAAAIAGITSLEVTPGLIRPNSALSEWFSRFQQQSGFGNIMDPETVKLDNENNPEGQLQYFLDGSILGKIKYLDTLWLDASQALVSSPRHFGDLNQRLYTATTMLLATRIHSDSSLISDIAYSCLKSIGVDPANNIPNKENSRRTRTSSDNISNPQHSPGVEGCNEKDDDISIIIPGTFAFSKKWWRSGDDFFEYIKQSARRNLYSGGRPFTWSGALRESHRKAAAGDLCRWINDDNSKSIDTIFSHSYGSDVLSKAVLNLPHDTVKCLVFLSSPVTNSITTLAKMPGRHERIIDLRLRVDLVLLAAACQQRMHGQDLRKSSAEVHYLPPHYIDHSCTHSPKVWEDQNLIKKLKL